MVAGGATNPEVAAALDVSLDGAKWHLREIFAKLGVDSREEAAEAWRAHRALPARGRRALRAIFGLAALKVAAGAAAVAAIGVTVAFAVGGPDDPGAEAQSRPQSAPQLEAWIRIVGSSMEPALHDGDRHPLDVLAYVTDAPERGDIVAFADPRESRQVLVKRVIGLPGDTVEIVDDVVLVNGSPLTEAYALVGPGREQAAPLTLPPGSYYLLGDNRYNSLDSRSHGIGLIPSDLILGEVILDAAEPTYPQSANPDPTPSPP